MTSLIDAVNQLKTFQASLGKLIDGLSADAAPATPTPTLPVTPTGTPSPTINDSLTVPKWTVITPVEPVFYVAYSGKDSAAGTQDAPFATIAKALSAGAGTIMLKRGDVFLEKLGLGGSTKCKVVADYGDAELPRPIIHNDSDDACQIYMTSDIVIQGIDFAAPGKTGIHIINSSDVTIEDCWVSDCQFGVTVESNNATYRCQNITLMGNVIVHNYPNPQGHSSGVFVSHTDGLLLEFNLLDGNGWSEQQAFDSTTPPSENHNLYGHETNGPIVCRNNIVARACANGLMLRPGGECSGNVMVWNPIHMIGGGDNFAATSNVFYGTQRLGGTATYDEKQYNPVRGWGIEIEAASASAVGNLFMSKPGAGYAISIEPAKYSTQAPQQVNLNANAVCNWSGDSVLLQGGSPVSGQKTLPSFALPASINDDAVVKLLAAARQQQRRSWNPSLTAPAIIGGLK